MNDPKFSFILMAVLFGAMYFFLIKPQKKKEKEIAEMREALSVGDDVLTIGGIYGKIMRVRDDRLVIQVGADKTRMEIAKWAVSQNLSDPGRERKSEKVDSKTEDEEEQAASRPNPKKFRRLGAVSTEADEGDADED